jgi:hypothetical protein
VEGAHEIKLNAATLACQPNQAGDRMGGEQVELLGPEATAQWRACAAPRLWSARKPSIGNTESPKRV